MKLAKRISKGIALCAVLTVISVWGGVLTSCSNGSEDIGPVTPPADDDEEDPVVSALELTSIIDGIVADDNVWGSGTSVKKMDDVYVVVAGKGWDEEGMASILVCFDAGVLDGCEYIVLDGVDTSAFVLRDDNDEYPSIELKITDGEDTAAKTKIISATKLLKDNKIEIPLADVKADILKDAAKIIISFRGTGTVKIKDISKAKAKVSQSSPSESGKDPIESGKDPEEPKPEEPKPEEPKPEEPKPEEPKPEEPKPETPPSLETTSIIDGIVAGDNVWGSGTKTVKEADGSYTVTAAGEGVGSWGGKIAAIPVEFDAGDLVGFSHIVVEADISGFTLDEDSEAHPSIELKITNDDDSKVQIINATELLKNNKIEIPLTNVKKDVLEDAKKIILSFRGTGVAKVKDISKAKAK